MYGVQNPRFLFSMEGFYGILVTAETVEKCSVCIVTYLEKNINNRSWQQAMAEEGTYAIS